MGFKANKLLVQFVKGDWGFSSLDSKGYIIEFHEQLMENFEYKIFAMNCCINKSKFMCLAFDLLEVFGNGFRAFCKIKYTTLDVHDTSMRWSSISRCKSSPIIMTGFGGGNKWDYIWRKESDKIIKKLRL